MDKQEGGKPKNMGTPTRDVLYSEAAKHAPRAIDILVEIMEKGDNDNSRLGAARTILAKAIPDLKAMELTGANGGAIQLKYIVDLAGGYIPQLGVINVSSGAGNTGPSQVQSTGVAQESEEDNNSVNGDNQAGTV